MAKTNTNEDLEKAVWTTAYENSLPDSSFAYVEPGDKDSEGKTTPRSKRHLPYKDANGKVDPAHVRNALARLNQTDIPAAAKASAKRKLLAAAKQVGIDAEKAEGGEQENMSKKNDKEDVVEIIKADEPEVKDEVKEEAPVEAPKEEIPAEAPVEAPKEDATAEPKAEEPKEETPAPAVEAPVEEAKAETEDEVEKRKKEEPKEEPKAEEPVIEEPKAEEPKVEAPAEPAPTVENKEVADKTVDLLKTMVDTMIKLNDKLDLIMAKAAPAEGASDAAEDPKPEVVPSEEPAPAPVEVAPEAPKEEVKEDAIKADTSSRGTEELLKTLSEVQDRLSRLESEPAPSKVVAFARAFGVETPADSELAKIDTRLEEISKIRDTNPEDYTRHPELTEEAFNLIAKKRQLKGV